MKEIITIKTEKELNSIVANEKGILIIECFKEGSGALQIMEPILHKLRLKYSSAISHIRFQKYNESTFLEENYLIYKYPSYLFFKNGVLFARSSEIIPLKKLCEIIESAFIA